MLVPADVRFTQLPTEALATLDAVAGRARELLNAILVVERDGARVALRISEVEAYAGGFDPASHAYRGLSPRNKAMFGPPWHSYVYRHMGLHTCMNVVVGEAGEPTGILLRAGEIVDGVEVARARRLAAGVSRSNRDLAAGPARLTVALGITVDDDGHPLDGSTGLLLEPRVGPRPRIVSGPRIGVGKAVDFPLRFSVADDPTLSR